MKKDENKDSNTEQMNKDGDLPYDLFNYCDYRCDKCDYAPECPVFQEEARFSMEGKPWPEVLEENLKKTAGLLQEIMDDEGMIFAPDSDEYELEYQKMREVVNSKLPYRLSTTYMEEAMGFLKSYSPAFLVLSRLDDVATDLGSYATILPVKVQRTLMSLYHFVVEEDDFHLVDAYLTSQVVYKAINTSLAAVGVLQDVLEEESRELDDLESLLLQLRSAYWHEFPFEILVFLLHSISRWEKEEGSKKKEEGSKKKEVGRRK